ALMSILDRHGRKVALSNLEVAFGDRYSQREREQIARQSFQHFARTMLDLLWSPRLTAENFGDYIEFENLEEIDRASGPERSFINACYHYSNFEWFSLASGYSGLGGTIISQEFRNSLLDPIFRKLREQSGHDLIPRQGGIVRLYKVLRRNPAPWLWMYKHWRYKPAGADRPYPFYARPHRRFDKRIAGLPENKPKPAKM